MGCALLGIVTRCPLVLKLKKLVNEEDEWKGKVSYRDSEIELSDASQVEKEVSAGKCPTFMRYHLFGHLVNQAKCVGPARLYSHSPLCGPVLVTSHPLSLPPLSTSGPQLPVLALLLLLLLFLATLPACGSFQARDGT